MRKVLDRNGMSGVPCRVAGVFTNRHAVLAVGDGTPVRTLHDFLAELKEQAAEEREILDPVQVSKQISGLIEKKQRQ